MQDNGNFEKIVKTKKKPFVETPDKKKVKKWTRTDKRSQDGK